MKFASTSYAIASLLLANLIPLYGVMFQGWNVFSLILVYWLESAVIGYFTIQKMKKAEGDGLLTSQMEKAMLIPFFCIHYGAFMFVHLTFLLIFFFNPSVHIWGVLISFLSLCLSHAVSYYTNFIGQNEYKHVNVDSLFWQPYPRIIVMHLTVILGGILVMGFGQSTLAFTIMIGLKITADLFAHLREHRQNHLPSVKVLS